MSTIPTLPGPRRAASTSTRRDSLSKPELSRLILSSTGAFVSVVLIAWLIWAARLPRGDRNSLILAAAFKFPAVSRTIAFPGRDGQAINGWGKWDPRKSTTLDAFSNSASSLLEKAGRRPAVIYITGMGLAEVKSGSTGAMLLAGDLGSSGGDVRIDLRDLIRKLAEKKKGRKLLILLDLGPVGSDRNLQAFGNSFVRALESLQDSSEVAVIAACAPGQLNWASEVEHRSVFSYFVEQGLSGEAARWNDQVTVQSLLDYVRPRVAAWVAEHRGGAIQTPILLSKAGADFELPPFKPGPGPGRPDPKLLEEVRKSLIAAWEAHHELAKSRPYLFAPMAWTRYEEALLEAERLFRADDFIEADKSPVEKALVNVASLGQEAAKSAVRPAPTKPRSWAIRRRRGGESPELDDYRALNDKFVDYLAAEPVAVTPPSDPKQAPGRVEKNPAGPARTTPPPAAGAGSLTLLDSSGLPTFVEGQPLAWYQAFVNAGGEGEAQIKSARLKALRKAVEVRFLAEEAAAADERISSRIRDLVDAADVRRREAQDNLFSGDESLFDSAEAKLAEASDGYREAIGLAARIVQAVDLLDQLSSELPHYGEWQARRPEGPGEDLGAILDGAAALADLVDPEVKEGKKAPENLSDAVNTQVNDLRSKYGRLVRSFETAAKSASTADWRAIDALLCVPAIDPGVRMELLERIRSAELSPSLAAGLDVEAATEPKTALDPAFWGRSIALAELEAKLLLLAGSRPDADGLDVDGLLAKAKKARDRGDSAEALGHFQSFSDAARARWAALAEPVPSTDGSDPRSLARFRHALSRADRAGRLMPLALIDQDVDPSGRFLRYALHSLLVWHARRLADEGSLAEADRLLGDAQDFMDTPEARDAASRLDLARRATLTLEGAPGSSRPGENRRVVEVVVRQKGYVPPIRPALFLARKDPLGSLPLVASGSADSPPALLSIGAETDPPKRVALRVAGSADADAVPKLFYQGKVIRSVDSVKVQGGIEELVSIDIRQHYSARALRGRKPSSIRDQFLDHPRQGYIHPRDTLEYKLVIVNKSGRELRLCVRGKTPDRLRFERTLTLAAGATDQDIIDVIGPDDFTDPRKDSVSTSIPMAVQVTEVDKNGPPLCSPMDVEFRMIHPKDFIVVGSPGFGYKFNKKTGETMAYISIPVSHGYDRVKMPAEVAVRMTPVGVFMQDDDYPARQMIPEYEVRRFGFFVLSTVPDYTWEVDAEGVLGIFQKTVGLNEKKPVPADKSGPNAPDEKKDTFGAPRF